MPISQHLPRPSEDRVDIVRYQGLSSPVQDTLLAEDDREKRAKANEGEVRVRLSSRSLSPFTSSFLNSLDGLEVLS